MPKVKRWAIELTERGITDRARDLLRSESFRDRGDLGPRQLRSDRASKSIFDKIRAEHPELPRSAFPKLREVIDQQRREVNRFNRWYKGEVKSPTLGKAPPGTEWDIQVVVEREDAKGKKYGGRDWLERMPFTDPDLIEDYVRTMSAASRGPIGLSPPTPGFVDVSKLPIVRVVIIDVIKR